MHAEANEAMGEQVHDRHRHDSLPRKSRMSVGSSLAGTKCAFWCEPNYSGGDFPYKSPMPRPDPRHSVAGSEVAMAVEDN